jgi:hypothetical protein
LLGRRILDEGDESLELAAADLDRPPLAITMKVEKQNTGMPGGISGITQID